MFLEEVIIEGFKSFSIKTEMGFQPGISVIVGNNGVGKSNILDAIVWALGENDLGRLRCLNRQELFFAGSEDCPPAQRVSVELKFRHEQGTADSGLNIRREVERNGPDRFFLDNHACSPDQLNKALAAHRLHQSLKTIVRQERINDLLLVDPVERLEKVCALLNLPSTAAFEASLKDAIGETFQRYMLHLVPNDAVALELTSHNGRRGIDLVVTLPGNRTRKAHQLSGGEKAVASLALKLALFRQLENPFFLLDEVEPSLDYSHHKSMQAFLKAVAADTQLIMITHLRSTIELADTLHGVRTRWDGSSFMKFYFDMDERLLRLYKCC